MNFCARCDTYCDLELDRLREENAKLKGAVSDFSGERHEWQSRQTVYRDTIERLRAALDACVESLRPFAHYGRDVLAVTEDAPWIVPHCVRVVGDGFRVNGPGPEQFQAATRALAEAEAALKDSDRSRDAVEGNDDRQEAHLTAAPSEFHPATGSAFPLTGEELAAKHGFEPHGRDPLTGGVPRTYEPPVSASPVTDYVPIPDDFYRVDRGAVAQKRQVSSSVANCESELTAEQRLSKPEDVGTSGPTRPSVDLIEQSTTGPASEGDERDDVIAKARNVVRVHRNPRASAGDDDEALCELIDSIARLEVR